MAAEQIRIYLCTSTGQPLTEFVVTVTALDWPRLPSIGDWMGSITHIPEHMLTPFFPQADARRAMIDRVYDLETKATDRLSPWEVINRTMLFSGTWKLTLRLR